MTFEFKERTKDMSDKFKSTVLWTLYVAVVLIGIFTIVLLGVNVLAPTFFPNQDISGIKEYINTFCVILSFLSVGLGIYSIWQASVSGKQANEILKSIQAIEYEQNIAQGLMRVITNVVDNGKTIQTSDASKAGAWKQDNDTK